MSKHTRETVNPALEVSRARHIREGIISACPVCEPKTYARTTAKHRKITPQDTFDQSLEIMKSLKKT